MIVNGHPVQVIHFEPRRSSEPQPELNIPLIRKVMEYLTAHPEEHDQLVWAQRTPCGTTACMAGHTVLLTGGQFLWSGDQADYCILPGDDFVARHEVDDAAQDALGLTTTQAVTLFYECDTLDELWRYVEFITGGQVSRSPA